MAKMIPSNISEEAARKSPAEARIFGWLRNMSWGNATVLYSQPLKDHIQKSWGEVDFIVLCDLGVLCVEIKGGRVKRENGRWGFTNREGKTDWKDEGPYAQVQGNMKSLRKYLCEHLNHVEYIENCRFASCVMTPDCIITADDDAEIIPEITFNLKMKEVDMPSVFQKSFNYWDKEKHYGGKEGLSAKEREKIATFLRGDFEFIPPLSILLERTEEQLVSVTSEQLEIIMRMNVNARMMVEGGAGTGKTLLAVEQCRRAAIRGERVLYLCYNSMIANYVKEVLRAEELDKKAEAHTLDEFLMQYCEIDEVGDNVEYFFKSELPNRFLNLVTSNSKSLQRFDRVIIDEGQDLMNMSSYMCIDNIIDSGWEKGNWTIYYDPKQNIFGTNVEFQDVWETLKTNSFIYPLTVNCRNTRQIALGNYAVTLVYKPEVMRADGEEINYRPYKDKKDELIRLFESIRHLRSEGIAKRDIVILSYYSIDNDKCCLKGASIPSDVGSIVPNVKKGFSDFKNIRFYTVQAFKGMESKAVIMIDVDSFSDSSKRLLNYVGMSRARTYLEFFFDASLQQERQQRLLESLL